MDQVLGTPPVSNALRSFDELGLSPRALSTIHRLGFKNPTPIQVRAIPIGQGGRDLVGLAQTGTGKTLAFSLPMVERLLSQPGRGVRALILAPTRELADQIHETVQQLVQGTSLTSTVIYGGVSHGRQVEALRRFPSIVVACPGRLLDHMGEGNINLSGVEVFVLDEADRMFDMGFLPNVRRIAKMLPKKRQTMLFSATMPDEMRNLARELLVDPETVRVAIERPVALITHGLYDVDQHGKLELLGTWLESHPESVVVVFTQMKHVAKRVSEKLSKLGVKATSLHGNLSQNRRKEALEGFKSGRYSVMVATDIAARGIDVEGVTHVVNYDMPDTLENYIHRSGRAGRASRTGQAISFVTSEDAALVRSIERYLGSSIKVLGRHRSSRPEQSRVDESQQPGTRERRSLNGGGRHSQGGRGRQAEQGARRSDGRPGQRRSSQGAPGQGRSSHGRPGQGKPTSQGRF